jgi:hypothetical protein
VAIDVNIMENGNLKITADKETREEICYMWEDGKSFWSILCELFEDYSCNGSYTPFDAGDANPFVGLTNAPCIAETMDYLDNGELELIGRFWYFADYMITNPFETLRDTGEIIFNIAE